MTLPPLLIVKTGSTHPDVIRSDGDYEAWFIASLEGGPDRTTVHPAAQKLPDPQRFGGVILTGSPLSVRDESPWMDRLGAWALEAADRGVPVLAVCFGHQLVGEALGGRVGVNPAGPEYGTSEVRLTAAGRSDPLFAGLPERIAVQQTHNDALVSAPPPERAQLLAAGESCDWQAFSAGPHLRAVQFHPELRADTLRRLLDARGRQGQTRPTEHGYRVLRNWDEHFVRGQ
ncbi:glutamine amidotransferase-related protein [Vulgatibacter sp.]|uniref:glutamine amidotransferase-related protein n=1 Tax=Vulgatibacter sp. TaxID=1971226 RepID=UPI003562BDCC